MKSRLGVTLLSFGFFFFYNSSIIGIKKPHLRSKDIYQWFLKWKINHFMRGNRTPLYANGSFAIVIRTIDNVWPHRFSFVSFKHKKGVWWIFSGNIFFTEPQNRISVVIIKVIIWNWRAYSVSSSGVRVNYKAGSSAIHLNLWTRALSSII